MPAQRLAVAVFAATVAILAGAIAMWFFVDAQTLSLVAKIVVGVLTTGIALFALYDESMGKKMSRVGTLSLIAMVLVWTVVSIFADTKASDADQLELTTDLVDIMTNLNALESQMLELEQTCASPSAMKPIAQKRREVKTQLDASIDRLRQGIAKRR